MLVFVKHGPFRILLCSVIPLLTTSWTHDFAAQIRRVEIIPTVDLVMDALANGKNCGHARITSEADATENWLDPKMYPRSLQSVLVHAVDRYRGPKMCVLMADNRFSLWDESDSRAAVHESPKSHWRAKGMLPAMMNVVHAVRQGYDFAHVHLPVQSLKRHPAWWKLAAIRIMLHRYSFVLFMDTDAFFRQPGIPRVIDIMVAEAQLARGGKIMAVARDLSPPDIANTGILLFAQSAQACNILHDWWYSVVHHAKYAKYRVAWSWEQAVFSQLLFSRYNESITLLDASDWNSPEGKHLRNTRGDLPDRDREALFVEAALDMVDQLGGNDARQGGTSEQTIAQLATFIYRVIAHKLWEKHLLTHN